MSIADELDDEPIPAHDKILVDAAKNHLLKQVEHTYGKAWNIATWITWRERFLGSPTPTSVGPRDAGFHQMEHTVMSQNPGRYMEDSMGMMLDKASLIIEDDAEDSIWEFEFTI